MGRGIRSNQPKKLNDPEPLADDQRRAVDPEPSVPPCYMTLVNVYQGSVTLADGTVPPWAALIGTAPEAPHWIEPRFVIGSTLAELWELTRNKLEELGDEVGMMVGSRWSLEGDPAAWIELREREGLTETPRGLPIYRISDE